MKKKKPSKRVDRDNPELTDADFKRMVPFEHLPASLRKKLKTIQKMGRPKSEAPKQMIAFRFNPEIIDAIKATGKGYNVRVENLLRQAIEQGHLGK